MPDSITNHHVNPQSDGERALHDKSTDTGKKIESTSYTAAAAAAEPQKYLNYFTSKSFTSSPNQFHRNEAKPK